MSTCDRCLWSLLFLSLICGCGKTESESNDSATNDPHSQSSGEDADPHDVPLTDAEIATLKTDTAQWSAAIQHVQRYRDKIKAESTGDTPANAHRSLDLLDRVLTWLPEIAQKSGVAKEDWEAVGESSQKLRDAFNTIHGHIDAGEPPAYESVADEIDAAVAALVAIEVAAGTDQ